MTLREGGCHCGAVRFEVEGEPREIGYCHCSICRRLSGGPAQVYAEFPASKLRYTKGAPQVYRSSATAQRRFCPTCGSHLEFRNVEEADWVSLELTALDRPADLAPQRHIFHADRLAWFEVDDDLPRSAGYE
jgi:hypothetical protein